MNSENKDRKDEIDAKIDEIREERHVSKESEDRFHIGYTGMTHVPIGDMASLPLGYNPEYEYRKLFPVVHLPFQKIERIKYGNSDLLPNRLIWGDNLHIMRQLPNESIDLIYVDPPFFSDRKYDIIWGDDNELRSFVDKWDGGMEKYLIWFNARLLEMKRLLKQTGSIYVHLDWHASHYVKVEMDKIFGYENFRNEIIWSYQGTGEPKRNFKRKHDALLFYSKSDNYFFSETETTEEISDFSKSKFTDEDKDGKYKTIKHPDGTVHKQYIRDNMRMRDVWEIPIINAMAKERIGYPTQKPEALLERIIKASSKPGDTVADFFSGGGTTIAVAQRLRRNWIGCDQSRIAVAVARDRLLGSSKKDTSYQAMLNFDETIADISIEYWGCYEIDKFVKYSDDEFKNFIIEAYGAVKSKEEEFDAYKKNIPILIGSKNTGNPVTPDTVLSFAKNLDKYQKKKGIIIAWEFTPQAREVIGLLKNDKDVNINTIEVSLVSVDSKEFRSHVNDLSIEYSDILTFVYQPEIRVGSPSRLSPMCYRFDIRNTISKNGIIINVQWDFNYDSKIGFKSTKEYTFTGKNKKLPEMLVEYKFDIPGNRKIACKVQDCKGGEGIKIIDLLVG